MVKNTSSHSAASISYGTITTMTSTVKSGIVATESFLGTDNSGQVDGILEMLDTINARKNRNVEYQPFVWGTENSRTRLVDGQFFSSKLMKYNSESYISQFEINSGKNASGRNLKKADVFIRLGNVMMQNGENYNAKNAVYMKGPLQNGDNGMEVNGNATFEGDVKFQNQPGIFRGEAFFSGNVNIQNGSTTFYDKAYFDKSVTFQNFPERNIDNAVFRNGVGINGNFTTQGSDNAIRSAGNVYINGGFRKGDLPTSELDGSASFKGIGTNSFHYTNSSAFNLTLSNNECIPNPSNPTQCLTHLGQTMGSHSNDSRVTNFSNKTISDGSMDILASNRLNMNPIEERRDPQLDISKIDNSIIKSASDVLGTNFTVANLTAACDAALQASPPQTYNGHLVLKVGRGEPAVNFSNSNPGTFDGKVIFLVEDGATFNVGQNFYHSGENSSTLIHVGTGSASLQQFGSSGPFRGLIYIDAGNISTQNSFNFKAGASIQGAVHNFSGGLFEWNGGGAGTVPITYNETVLNQFGALKIGATATESTVIANPDNYRIIPRPIGYYFH
jgi:hypothetical protein